MYNFFLYYSAIAVATGVTSYLLIFRPLIREIINLDIDHPMSNNPKLTAFSTIFVSTLIAPLMIKSILFLDIEEFVTNYVQKIKDSKK